MTAARRHPAGPASPSLRAFVIEVRTAAGQLSRYDALAPSSCDALLDAMDLWGFAKINVSPRGAT